MSQTKQSSESSTTDTTKPVWCPEQQIYLGGVIPGASNADLERLLADNQGALRVFGYGSLCWNPGPPDTALGNLAVTATLGHARHYRRVWGQKSTDHRGTPIFPGVVCTLLQTSEVKAILRQDSSHTETSTSATTTKEEEEDLFMTTEGMIYLVPPHLAQTCLTELDFREKGGYAREIIEVVEDASGNRVHALLYRGTPDNPAFSSRLVRDLPFAAAIIAVSVGPSGPNDVYLNQLNEFLVVAQQQQQQQQSQKQVQSSSDILHDDTCTLANMTGQLQQPDHGLYFFYGSGSNQHGQIINYHYNYNSALQQGDKDQDFQQLTESVVFCQYPSTSNHNNDNDKTPVDPPKEIVAGGGHSGLLTKSGQLFLWGWNDQGQCASASLTNAANNNHDNDNHAKISPLPVLRPLPNNLLVEKVALGFSHTVVIEKETRRLYAFGDNSHGQVTGAAPTAGTTSNSNMNISTPTIPPVVDETDQFVAVAAGLFHSAAITTQGELVTFGSGKHGQCLPTNTNSNSNGWKPPDQSRLVQVVCGRYHTAVLDDQGRIWTMGDNKYGQLGRDIVMTIHNDTNAQQSTSSSTRSPKPPTFDPIPQLVDGPLGKDSHNNSNHVRCVQLESGWSHLVARVERISDSAEITPELFGWGRNDKGQLACHEKIVPKPSRIILQDYADDDQISSNIICHISCGSESTYILVENKMTATFSIHSCGWNEHGNLGLGATSEIGNSVEDAHQLTQLPGTERIVSPPTYSKDRRLLMAAGGAHFLTIMT